MLQCLPGRSLRTPIFFARDPSQGPPTANHRHQPPTATNHHQPPTANRQSPPPCEPFWEIVCNGQLFCFLRTALVSPKHSAGILASAMNPSMDGRSSG